MFFMYHEGCYARHIPAELRVDRFYPATGKLRVPKDYRRNPHRELSVDVNWGCGPHALAAAVGRLRRPIGRRMLNARISASVLKMTTFEMIDTWNKEREAAGELADIINHPMVSRDANELAQRGRYLARLDGKSGGEGIKLYDKGQLPDPNEKWDFFSLMVAKEHEVRIHVALGNVICEQVKYMPQGAVHPIRNYDNGARFSNKNIENVLTRQHADTARRMAINTAAALSLDFGAVDVMVSKRGNVYVLEFNSAPGITPGEDEREPKWDQPSTFDAYKNFFAGYLA